MTTLKLRDGPVTHYHSQQMVDLCEKWLLEYFSDRQPRKPGDLEDDFCGEPSVMEMFIDLQGRWRATPFYPALALLIDKGLIVYWQDEDDTVWYELKKGHYYFTSDSLIDESDKGG